MGYIFIISCPHAFIIKDYLFIIRMTFMQSFMMTSKFEEKPMSYARRASKSCTVTTSNKQLLAISYRK